MAVSKHRFLAVMTTLLVLLVAAFIVQLVVLL